MRWVYWAHRQGIGKSCCSWYTKPRVFFFTNTEDLLWYMMFQQRPENDVAVLCRSPNQGFILFTCERRNVKESSTMKFMDHFPRQLSSFNLQKNKIENKLMISSFIIHMSVLKKLRLINKHFIYLPRKKFATQSTTKEAFFIQPVQSNPDWASIFLLARFRPVDTSI